VGQVIVGLPRSLGGGSGQQAEKAKDFAEKLHSRFDVPFMFRDERFSTVSAKRLSRPTRRPKARQKVRYDAMAAALVLQAYLDEAR